MDISWLAALTRPAKRYITSIGMQLTASPHSLDGKLVRYVCWKAAIAHQRRARGFEQRAHALLHLRVCGRAMPGGCRMWQPQVI